MIISRQWISRFIVRNNLKRRAPGRLEPERIDQGRVQTVEEWFKLIEPQFQSKKYHPSLIANMDETMLSCKDARVKVIIPKERRTGVKRLSKETEHITLIVTLFADFTLGTSGVS